MRGLSSVTILGEVTAIETNSGTRGGGFYVIANVLEKYYIQTATGYSERKEYHRICIMGGAAKRADKNLKVGDILFTNCGMLRTTETKKGRWSKIMTYDIEILIKKEIEDKAPLTVPPKAVNSIKNIKDKFFTNKD